jgi:hypothetical protein
MKRLLLAAMSAAAAFAPQAQAQPICVEVVVTTFTGSQPAGHCQPYVGGVTCVTHYQVVTFVPTGTTVATVYVEVCVPTPI